MKKEKDVLKKIIKALKKVVFIFGIFVTVLFVFPYFFKDEIDKGIKEVAKNYIKTDVEYKELEISFFKHFPKLTVTLENSSIKSSSPFDSENLISAKEIALGVDVKSLFGDQIVFNELYIDQANIALKIDSIGRNNYDIIVSSDEVDKHDDSSVSLSLDDIKITQSNFLFVDQSSHINLHLDGFEYKGLVGFKGNVLKLNADTAIKDVFVKLDQETYVKHQPLKGKINTIIDINTLSFDFIDNQLELGNFPFTLKGSLQMPNATKVFDLKISSDNNDLKYIPRLIPEAYQEWAKEIEIKGSSNLLLTMKGIMNSETNQNPDLHIEAKIFNGLINYKKSQSPIQNLNLVSVIDLPALDPNKLRVNVEKLDFKILEGRTKTNFTYWAGNTIYSEGEITSTIDLEALKNAIGFKQISTKGILNLEGTWKGSIGTSLKKSIQKIPTFLYKSEFRKGLFQIR